MLRIYREQEEAPAAPTQNTSPKGDGTLKFDFDGNKIHFISLGCPRNLVDTEVMLGILL